MKLAIYAITVNGAKQGRRLKQSLPFADLFVAKVAIDDTPEAELLSYPLAEFVADTFSKYDGHIFICASGIVTRMISPLIKDKRIDPAVICLDEQARFVISMLSGHRGGANELTERVAHIVKATPVITTASDTSETVSADMFGAPFGWSLDPVSEPSITSVSAAIVNDQPVAIVQQAGEKKWWKYDKRMPTNIVTHTDLADIDPVQFSGLLLVSDVKDPGISQWDNRVVLWRPKSLVLGIGCDRNTPLSVLKAGIDAFSQEKNLSLDAIHSLSSIDLKKDEVGILELSAEKQWPFITFSSEELDGIEGIENPSEYVKKVTGSNSVAEAAALKQSDTKRLIEPKWVFKQDGYNMTVACCRKEFTESLVQHKRKNWFGQKKHGSEERHGLNTAEQIEVKTNAHGSEVVEGFQCKPKHVDLDRPMLFHRHHILLCEGKRCAKTGTKNLAHDLRNMLKEMGLASGNKRIKISRTMCAGACRNRSTLVVYERVQNDRASKNNAQWLRNVEDLSEHQWRELFQALSENRPLTDVIDKHYFAAVEDADKENNCG